MKGAYTVGPVITDRRTLPWDAAWVTDPRVDDGHMHLWESVLLGPPGHRVEEVVRCSVCHCPRCGGVKDNPPCVLRRHHGGDHAPALFA